MQPTYAEVRDQWVLQDMGGLEAHRSVQLHCCGVLRAAVQACTAGKVCE